MASFNASTIISSGRFLSFMICLKAKANSVFISISPTTLYGEGLIFPALAIKKVGLTHFTSPSVLPPPSEKSFYHE
jgi:hypothetical protein